MLVRCTPKMDRVFYRADPSGNQENRKIDLILPPTQQLRREKAAKEIMEVKNQKLRREKEELKIQRDYLLEEVKKKEKAARDSTELMRRSVLEIEARKAKIADKKKLIKRKRRKLERLNAGLERMEAAKGEGGEPEPNKAGPTGNTKATTTPLSQSVPASVSKPVKSKRMANGHAEKSSEKEILTDTEGKSREKERGLRPVLRRVNSFHKKKERSSSFEEEAFERGRSTERGSRIRARTESEKPSSRGPPPSPRRGRNSLSLNNPIVAKYVTHPLSSSPRVYICGVVVVSLCLSLPCGVVVVLCVICDLL